MKTLLLIYTGVVLSIGSIVGYTHQHPATVLSAPALQREVTVQAVQGGTNQARVLQPTMQADHLQGSEGESLEKYQGGSQEQGDNLQPALGYQALHWTNKVN